MYMRDGLHQSGQGPLLQAADAPRLGRDGLHSHGDRVTQACQFAGCDPVAASRLDKCVIGRKSGEVWVWRCAG